MPKSKFDINSVGEYKRKYLLSMEKLYKKAGISYDLSVLAKLSRNDLQSVRYALIKALNNNKRAKIVIPYIQN